MNEQIMRILPVELPYENIRENEDLELHFALGYNCSIKDCAAAIEKANLVRCPTKKEILGAVARGWCDEGNSHKVMDVVLAVSIAESLLALLRGEK